ncbi:relaxase/mobilization nuclease domain-containing protein [Shewanella sp. 202IG2-18]|uniref:relaxase/mobilization nuclease domain-containing protein n=1 Tax=Parashewanella hymeniacidonis TaxID=2807618 RepID=UPI001960461E|nr:relaxase/mobilization nuclease domain-containing protein [Parashewanella hymeniacidonis]MBM7072902.1 relaxase/mobilization nuclease domain-containing protein [Parashewanella hymeniacidonis]
MSRLLNDQISGLLSGDVRNKSNRIKSLRSYHKKPPEVMVKISGHCKNMAHIQSHFEYISRNGQLDVEDELGQVYQDTDDLHQMAKQWCSDTSSTKSNTRHTTHIVLSMPNGTEPKSVKQAARAFAKNTFADNYQYVFALHTDTDSPHVHLTIKNLGFDGKRLHVKKGLPQIWREHFACELERLGIAAEATPSLRKWIQIRNYFYRTEQER